MNFADFKDRVKTDYPAAEVVLQDDGVIVARALGYACAVERHDQGHDVRIFADTHPPGNVTTVWGETLEDAYCLVMDKLNDAWRRAQQPRTSPGGPSPSRGGGDDLDDAVGDTLYEPEED